MSAAGVSVRPECREGCAAPRLGLSTALGPPGPPFQGEQLCEDSAPGEETRGVIHIC